MSILRGDLFDIIIRIITLLTALVGHEVAHGWVSYKLGDPTPKIERRLSLNPKYHLDPIGTLLMLFTGFGWAKPVSVNPMYYKNKKQGMAIVALAGPLSNFLMAIAGFFISIIIFKIAGYNSFVSKMASAFLSFTILNLRFMVFNLIPLPPLDGSKVLGMFLSNKNYYKMLQYEQYSMILLMVLSVTGVFDRIIGTGVGVAFDAIARLFAPFLN